MIHAADVCSAFGASPWLFVVNRGDVSWSSSELEGDNFILRLLDASKMETLDGFYRELSLSMGFPSYFGENLAALLDCMLDEASKDSAPLLIRVVNAEKLLIKSDVKSVHGIMSTFASVASSWARGIEVDEEWGSAPRKLFFLLEYS